MEDVKNMTIKELQELKERRYNQAKSLGVFLKLATIARHLGNHLTCSYGPKYQYEKDGIDIYVDDYGNYMTVTVDGKNVASTHFCDQFIIPAPWLDEVLELYPQACQVEQSKLSERDRKEREKLLKQII